MVRAFSHSGPLRMTSISIVGDSFTQVLTTRMPFVIDYSVWIVGEFSGAERGG